MENRFLKLIEVLVRHDVRFIVVGGIAAFLQRVPVNTQDFDLVHDRARDNVARWVVALAELFSGRASLGEEWPVTARQ